MSDGVVAGDIPNGMLARSFRGDLLLVGFLVFNDA